MARISIISGVYNCAETLPEAIESILRQTVTDWEWILCDDASSDNTMQVLEAYRSKYPEKFILLRNDKNQGLNFTLNRCLRHANGELIARMDGDDVCAPERFEVELAALEAEPDIDIVSTDMEFFDETGVWGCIAHPTYPQPEDLIRGTPFCHAPCMVRRAALEAVGGYTEGKRFLRVEDYHLWLKMYAAGYRGKNIHLPLYQMRDDHRARKRRKLRYRFNEAHVMKLVCRTFHLCGLNRLRAIRPIAVGLMPSPLYHLFHHARLKRNSRQTGNDRKG